jgi:hypothetical protein
MGKKKNSKKFQLGSDKSVNVTPFKGKVYTHFWDGGRKKNVSLNKKEFIQLTKSIGKISRAIQQCEKKKKKKEAEKEVLSSSSEEEESTQSESDIN